MSILLIASSNAGKKLELDALLAGQSIELRSLADYPDLEEVEETGETFMENARRKAETYAKATGLWTLGDDSGLEVLALGGAPGVHSARFAGEAKDDAANIAKLLELLKGESDRRARFQTALVLANPSGVQVEARGFLDGRILKLGRGDYGFGYDPIFAPDKDDRSLAEMAPEEKNAISHRARALQDLLPEILDLLQGEEKR